MEKVIWEIEINTENQERFPSVLKDLGILFFTRATNTNYDDIFWIDSKLINEVKNKSNEDNR